MVIIDNIAVIVIEMMVVVIVEDEDEVKDVLLKFKQARARKTVLRMIFKKDGNDSEVRRFYTAVCLLLMSLLSLFVVVVVLPFSPF